VDIDCDYAESISQKAAALHQANFVQVTRWWTGFIYDPERYPRCDWLKTSYFTKKVTFCQQAA